MQFLTRPGWSRECSPLVEGGVCLWGTPDPVCARHQLHFTLLHRSRCLMVLPVPSGHRFLLDGEAEAVGIPAQGLCSSVGRDAAAPRVDLTWSLGIWL